MDFFSRHSFGLQDRVRLRATQTSFEAFFFSPVEYTNAEDE